MCIFDSLHSGYDRGMLLLELLLLRRLRRRTFPPLRGHVLELGVGTGVNLPLYQPGASVTGCDASGRALKSAARRRPRAPASLVQADVHRLPFADGSFDVVAASLVFCSIADPARGLAEARRVLRRPEPRPGPDDRERDRRAKGHNGGRLVLLEHTRGTGIGAWLTDVLQPVWNTWSHECRLNRETAQTVAATGFQMLRVEQHVLGIVRVIEATVSGT